MKTIKEVYASHAEIPYIAEEYQEELLVKPIPKWAMVRTEEGLLPGHLIMLWRVNFGTYTTSHPHHKYFATSYGIDAQKELDYLIEQGYAQKDGAFASLQHLPARQLKELLKEKQVAGLSKMKRQELDQAMQRVYTEEELAGKFELRGYSVLPKGARLLEKYPEIVAKHPQKKY
ncbi:hypothetical protein [Streptococcus cuniculipharyngis]|uniref:Uncharacterized protein n=1 Tax=Streptococcus cuniculipharyngis TaxID=1562651 RepID=A0A5C5SGK7_9STRE|nr:hypothetical protein [Streptococcus cuniculipharyngis]TWS99085.1 hypothetical protein FRX57_02455 [Streptococcus cuniculipharyngis]